MINDHQNDTTSFYDVIIIGGSYAGLSAALALGRSLRRVLIIDSGLPCNRNTPHSQNFLTHDGEKPSVIASIAKDQLTRYENVEFLSDKALSAITGDEGFTISTQSGKRFLSKKLVFATGITDTMPPIKGFADCWGISVVHCPYCHGYELRNLNTAIIANGEKAFHLASLVKNLTQNVTILTRGEPDFTAVQLDKLNANKVEVISKDIIEIIHENGHVRMVIFADQSTMHFRSVYAVLPFTQHSDIPLALGCEFSEDGRIKIDAFQRTSVKGVYACGDNSAMFRSVANAVYSGNLTGAAINKELCDEQF